MDISNENLEKKLKNDKIEARKRQIAIEIGRWIEKRRERERETERLRELKRKITRKKE